jgi:hypothetical protein
VRSEIGRRNTKQIQHRKKKKKKKTQTRKIKVFQGWTSFKPFNNLLHSFQFNAIPLFEIKGEKQKREKSMRVFVFFFFLVEEGKTGEKLKNTVNIKTLQ